MLISKTQDNTKVMKLFFLIALSLYNAKGVAKLMLILITGIVSTPIVVETKKLLVPELQKYLIPETLDNWAVFFVLLVLDLSTGLYKHSGLWEKGRKHTLDKDEFFIKLFKKVFIGSVWLILLNVIYTLGPGKEYFQDFGISALVAWLGWSIVSNCYISSSSTFPPEWVMEYFKKLNKQHKKPEQ